jgi:flagellar hook assembly protein FlgD
MVTTVPVGIEELKALVPTQFSFSIGYPNPFRSATTMHYTIPLKTEVHLDIYDATGRLVRRLVDDTQKPGAYRMRWDGIDTRGLKCASGIYFVKFEAGEYTSTRKAVLLK